MPDLALPFGINLLSSAAFTHVVHRFRTEARAHEKSFSGELAGFLRRRDERLDIPSGALAKVVFVPGVWLALLRNDPGDSSWDHLLFDIMKPEFGIDSADLALLLGVGIRTQGSLDLQATLAGLDDLSDLRDDLSELRDDVVLARAQLSELHRTFLEWIDQTNLQLKTDVEVRSSIRSHLASMRIEIDKLTDQQKDVIRTLHGVGRALIPGAAGSGKTIVASQKAILLAEAGIRTLLLCHNPWLAEHLERLTADSRVEVRSFGSWIASLTGDPTVDQDWTRYQEPSAEALYVAFGALVAEGGRWQAIIVDEGQDFTLEWWDVVEAGLTMLPGLLYIFADDDQRLVSKRNYPKMDEVSALSRNCRNAGGVYNAMRSLVPQLPRVEGDLADLGSTTLVLVGPGKVIDSLPLASAELRGVAEDEQVVVLTMDGQADAVIDRFDELPTTIAANWQDGVVWELEDLLDELSNHKWYERTDVTEAERLSLRIGLRTMLSDSPSPTADDVRTVCAMATRLKGWVPKVDWGGSSNPVRLIAMEDGSVALQGSGHRFWHAKVKYFLTPRWVETLPRVQTMELARRPLHASAAASVRTISEFKGLEADTVIVLWDPVLSAVPEVELYVAVSRARMRAVIVAPKGQHALPEALFARTRVLDVAS